MRMSTSISPARGMVGIGRHRAVEYVLSAHLQPAGATASVRRRSIADHARTAPGAFAPARARGCPGDQSDAGHPRLEPPVRGGRRRSCGEAVRRADARGHQSADSGGVCRRYGRAHDRGGLASSPPRLGPAHGRVRPVVRHTSVATSTSPTSGSAMSFPGSCRSRTCSSKAMCSTSTGECWGKAGPT